MTDVIPTESTAAAADFAEEDEDDEEEDDDAVAPAVKGKIGKKKGKGKGKKNKKKKKKSAKPLSDMPPEILQLFEARNQMYADQLRLLFRTQSIIPWIHSAKKPNKLWFFVGKILTQPTRTEFSGSNYVMHVQDIDGMHVQCVLDTCAGFRFESLASLTVGKTLFMPGAVKGGDNGQFVVSQTMEDCIHAFPILLEDVLRMNYSEMPTDIKCELCSQRKGLELCGACNRVVYLQTRRLASSQSHVCR